MFIVHNITLRNGMRVQAQRIMKRLTWQNISDYSCIRIQILGVWVCVGDGEWEWVWVSLRRFAWVWLNVSGGAGENNYSTCFSVSNVSWLSQECRRGVREVNVTTPRMVGQVWCGVLWVCRLGSPPPPTPSFSRCPRLMLHPVFLAVLWCGWWRR